MRKLFKNKFEQLGAMAEEATAKRVEFQEQEHLSRLQTQIELPDNVAKLFHRMIDEFVTLTQCQRIWDITGEKNTNRAAERTLAIRSMERKPINFKLDHCNLIESEWKIPHLENANGGDIYLYPTFVLYFVSAVNFALLKYKDIQFQFSKQSFIEEESIPSDAIVTGHTWKKNK